MFKNHVRLISEVTVGEEFEYCKCLLPITRSVAHVIKVVFTETAERLADYCSVFALENFGVKLNVVSVAVEDVYTIGVYGFTGVVLINVESVNEVRFTNFVGLVCSPIRYKINLAFF